MNRRLFTRLGGDQYTTHDALDRIRRLRGQVRKQNQQNPNTTRTRRAHTRKRS